MKPRKFLVPAAAVAVLAVTLTACGGGSGSGNGGGGSDAASQGLDGRGPITFVTGKDNSNVWRPTIDRWNSAHPDQKVTLKEQTDNADQQHDDLVQHFQANDANYDVVTVDVVWSAEFAAKGWLQPLKDKMAVDTAKLLPATVKAATYNGTLYAVPNSSDGGLLYYRKDLVPTPPKTWDEMMSMCSIAKQHNMSCYAGQYQKYEGLTVNAAEAINTFGGKIVDDQGKATVNSPEAKAGLSKLVDAYKSGNIPKEGITYQEEQGRQAFEDGKLLFLRNWPYVYNLAKSDGASKVKDTFGVAPLPGKDGPGASSLGGHSAAISVYSKNKATAHDFATFLIQDEQQKFFATQGSLAPVSSELYKDPAIVAKLPYMPTLLTSIQNAVPRPVTPFYPAVTKAVQDNSYAALKGEKTVDQALSDMQAAIDAASASK
ncbi:ABC transporter substrate-binding protein [Arthrobacter sp. Y-9]|uniref:ABC transporter substrate-binding protein n=1 Tax=Arthrobacter sp. Y-9 TaxID=3039385 RepID=UPI00241F8541|nr:ABC transporter substrate-binding protein [Arthrobacter sp. Y-9]WFR84428.1 ABC transporter substrate-binding protein [Arthrobacter sp. Y-9]